MSLWWVPGIRFNDWVFTEPARLSEWRQPVCAGLFVVLAKQAQWAPKPFQPLYFGEFGNNGHSALDFDGWVPPAGRMDELYIAALPLPYSTTAQRFALRHELIRAYNPIAQADATRTSTRELARKVDAMELRQQEQNAQILALLQQLNAMFGPQPATPRRPIGFLAQAAAGA
jgi:hypothetical protein